MASTQGWRKSSYSDDKAHCVEIAPAERAVLVCDTKDHGAGPILAFPRAPWAAFLAAARAGEFD
jgi:hypothetical protein